MDAVTMVLLQMSQEQLIARRVMNQPGSGTTGGIGRGVGRASGGRGAALGPGSGGGGSDVAAALVRCQKKLQEGFELLEDLLRYGHDVCRTIRCVYCTMYGAQISVRWESHGNNSQGRGVAGSGPVRSVCG
jgi:hypothetical protein